MADTEPRKSDGDNVKNPQFKIDLPESKEQEANAEYDSVSMTKILNCKSIIGSNTNLCNVRLMIYFGILSNSC